MVITIVNVNTVNCQLKSNVIRSKCHFSMLLLSYDTEEKKHSKYPNMMLINNHYLFLHKLHSLYKHKV